MKKNGTMDSIWSRTLSFFHCICWSAALATILYCISVYIQNEDLCIVDYKQYYENKFDMLPTLSICLKDPFTGTELGTTIQTVNSSTYSNFLKSDYFSSEKCQYWLQQLYHSIVRSCLYIWNSMETWKWNYCKKQYWEFTKAKLCI